MYILLLIFAKMNKKTAHMFEYLRKSETPQIGIQFWKALQGPEVNQVGSQYIYMVYNNYLHQDKKGHSLEEQQRMITTMLAIEIYIAPKSKDLSIVEQFHKTFESKKKTVYGYPKWIFNLFIERHLSPGKSSLIQELVCKIMMAPISSNPNQDATIQILNQIQDCKRYLSAIEGSQDERFYEPLKLSSYPPTSGLNSKSLSFGYLCYHHLIKLNQNKVDSAMYANMVDILRMHMNALSHREALSYPYLVSLIHFITQNITFYGCPDEQILKQFLMWANQIRGCPDVLGQIGKQFFQMLHNQLKSPGYAFRKKLRSDFPTLDIKESKFINKPFYLVIPSDKNGEEWQSDEKIINSMEHCSLMNLRKLIIWQIIKTAGMIEYELKTFKQLLRGLNDHVTYILYFKIMKIMDLSLSLEVYEKIKTIQNESIVELMTHIDKSYNTSGQQKQSLQSEPDKQEFDYLLTDHALGLFKYPKYEVITISSKEFTSKAKTQYSFSEIVKQNRVQFPQLNFYRNKIPIVFYGSGLQFAKIVGTIAQFIQNTDIEKSRLLRIFYVPSPESKKQIGLGLYLAAKDIWYRRFVYNICRQKLLYPYIKPSENMKNLLPYQLFKNTVQMYMREAKIIFPVRVFKFELKIKGQPNPVFGYMISFLMLGMFTEAEIIHKTKTESKDKAKKYESMDVMDIITNKMKKSNPMILSMTYCKQHKGADKYYSESKLRVDDIQVCNFPKEYFMGNVPDPTTGDLQMALLTESSGKIFRKEVANRDNFKRHGEAEIRQAFKQLFACSTIKSLVIENNDTQRQFSVMIDSIFYHRVERIGLSPLISKNNLPVTLPIQCFLQFK